MLLLLVLSSAAPAFSQETASAPRVSTGRIERCVADTSAYYELSFDPALAEHADEYYQTEVKMADPNLIARTRLGYYAQP